MLKESEISFNYLLAADIDSRPLAALLIPSSSRNSPPIFTFLCMQEAPSFHMMGEAKKESDTDTAVLRRFW